MKRTAFGRTDLSVSPLCLGTANFGLKTDRKAAFELLDAFYEMGGNFLDTANVYCKWVPGKGNCSERVIGEWLRDRRPKDMVIATKGGHYSFLRPWVSRVTEKEVRRDLEESLRTLSRDCVDFYWLHRDNPGLSAEEISFFMDALVREGKIRFWGISNLTSQRAEQFGKSLQAVSNQWSLALEPPELAAKKDQTTIRADAQMLRFLEEQEIPLVPYTSGANGCFAAMEKGKSVPGHWDHPANRLIFETLSRWAQDMHVSAYTLGQAWLLTQPFAVFPVVAVSTSAHMMEFETICSLRISEECLKDLRRVRAEAESMI